MLTFCFHYEENLTGAIVSFYVHFEFKPLFSTIIIVRLIESDIMAS